ncbi:MAG: V-type ATPase 116kDa subunit family protein [Candidatus Micrarchaeota archaeon]
MLTLEKMQKVRIIAPRDSAGKIVQKLYDFGAIQVQECKSAELDSALGEFLEISEMLIRLRAEERLLGLKGVSPATEASLSDMKETYDSLKLVELDAKRRELQGMQAEILRMQEDLLALLPFRNLPINPKDVLSEKLASVYFEPSPQSEKALQLGLRKIAHEKLPVRDGKRNYILLAFDKRHLEKVMQLVAKNSLGIFEMPDIEGGFKNEIAGLEGRIEPTRAQTNDLKAWLADYAINKGPILLTLKEQLKTAALKAELPFKFGKTDHFSVVEGWIERKNLDVLRFEISGMESALIETVTTKDVPPSKLHNPKLIRPFEFMVEFFSLPKSYELDPTLFIAITYPLFFGMIMGDIGYGLLSLFAALAIKLKAKGDLLKRIGGMLALSAVSAIAFGIIYGEFFGLEHIFGIELAPLIHRANEMEEMINLSILLGALHLALGFLISVVTNALHKNYRHAAGKLGWILLEASMIATIIGIADIPLMHIFEPLKHILPMPYSPLGMVAGAIAIAVFEKPTHLLELPSLLSNVLSYMRIALLGLSGVLIALIINKLPVDFEGFFAMLTLSHPFDPGAFVGTLLFATLYVVGHVLALMLAILEAGVQSLRLHYVEFFSKFYEGGGLPFIPLRELEERKARK